MIRRTISKGKTFPLAVVPIPFSLFANAQYRAGLLREQVHNGRGWYSVLRRDS